MRWTARSLLALVVLFLIGRHITQASAEEVMLLDTTTATSDFNWRTWSNTDTVTGWTEETVSSTEGSAKNNRIYQACDIETEDVENWLLVPRLDIGSAKRVRVDVEFRMSECKSIDRAHRASCTETLRLYAAPLKQGEDLEAEWHSDKRWKQIDTIVARSDAEAVNFHTSTYDVASPYVHFAFKDTGACFAILSMQIHSEEAEAGKGAGFLSSLLNYFNDHLWLWIGLAALVLLLLVCCVCFTTRMSARRGRKTKFAADLDETDHYQSDEMLPYYHAKSSMMDISPKYGTSSPAKGSAAKRKSNVPLLIPVGPVQRSPTGQVNRHFRPYVDPKTYENPSEALAQFANEIPAHLVEVTRIIGSGEFGEVCCGRLTVADTYGNTQQQIVAVKTLLPGSPQKARDDFLIEASIMGQFEHENVIRLIGVVTRTEPIMIVSEYMLNGSLDKFLSSNDGRIETYHLVKMLHGIACGMRYLTEEKYYVHRDLAARNILVDDRLTCKIADFGLSRGLSKDPSSPIDQQCTTILSGGKIPIKWTAPEAITSNVYTAFSDVWSFGVVMWEVFSLGERPYGDWPNRKVMEEVAAGYRLPNPMDSPYRLYNVNKEHSAHLYELMQQCWRADATKRPSFSSIVSQLKNFIADLEHEMSAAHFGLKTGGLHSARAG